MLFTDGPVISAADLQNYENAILSVANIESIDLAGKIQLAQAEIANQLTLFLLRRLRLQDYWLMPRRIAGLGDVVVTDPLRQWHAHKALAMVYRDAYNNQLNDRYQGKWAEYEQLAKQSSEEYLRIGVGLTADPISKAALPILTTTGGINPGGMFYVAVTWINQAGQEGAPSDIAQITTADGQQLVVTAANPPANATGWNAYAGLSPDTICLQNGAPLAVNGGWGMPLGLQAGIRPGPGQAPTWFLTDQHVIERG